MTGVDDDALLPIIEETAARTAMAVSLLGIATGVFAGAVWLEYVVAKATSWIPLDTFVVPLAILLASASGRVRTLFTESMTDIIFEDIVPPVLSNPNTFRYVSNTGTDYRAVGYLFWSTIGFGCQMGVTAYARDVTMFCSSTGRLLFPSCPTLSVVVVFLDVAAGLFSVGSVLLVVAFWTTLLRWAVSRVGGDTRRPAELLQLFPRTVTDDTDWERTDDPADQSEGSISRNYALDFVHRASIATVALAVAGLTLTTVLRSLTERSSLSWTKAHITLVVLAALLIPVSVLLKSVSEKESELILRLQSFTLQVRSHLHTAVETSSFQRRLPAVNALVATVYLVVALVCYISVQAGLPAERRPVTATLGTLRFPPTANGYRSGVHDIAVVGILANLSLVVHYNRQWYRQSRLRDALEKLATAVSTGYRWFLETERRLSFQRPESATRWYAWIVIGFLGQAFFFGLALNEAVFGEPYGRLLLFALSFVPVQTIAIWLDLRSRRSELLKPDYVTLAVVCTLPPFGGMWYLLREG